MMYCRSDGIHFNQVTQAARRAVSGQVHKSRITRDTNPAVQIPEHISDLALDKLLQNRCAVTPSVITNGKGDPTPDNTVPPLSLPNMHMVLQHRWQ